MTSTTNCNCVSIAEINNIAELQFLGLIGEIIDPYFQILLAGNNLEGKKIVFAVESHGGGAFDNIHIFSLGKCLGIGRRHFNNI